MTAFPDIRVVDMAFHDNVLTPSILDPSPRFLVAAVLAISGYTIRLLCFRELGRFFTFELSRTSDHKLITSGPYSVVRHPAYTGSILGFLASAVCFTDPNSWVIQSGVLKTTLGGILFGGVWFGSTLVYLVTLVLRVHTEDEFLKREFGKEWDEWSIHVRSRIIPGVF